LTYEEIERISRIFLGMGINKIRITGGEPMLRRDLETLIRKLSVLPGLQDLALTTNGFNLAERAASLKEAGLHRVTISLDSLRKSRFFEITRSQEFEAVLDGIDSAIKQGLKPVKVNCVVVRGLNDDEILDFVEFAQEKQITVRFIEFMPLDEDEDWDRSRVVAGKEILDRIQARFQIVGRKQESNSQTASNFDLSGSSGGIGVITTISNPFCQACSRIRLTADGKVRNCLFSSEEHSIREGLRSDYSDSEIEKEIHRIVSHKESGHRINEPDFTAPPRSMSYIGG
jgi:cyclic pyranopterin phosphate synthase